MIDKNSNTCVTSSCGRLFDAVSSLLGISHGMRCEAEAAINLEKAAALSYDSESYPVEIARENDRYINSSREVDTRDTVRT